MIKQFLCIAGLAMLALPSARAFSLAGPIGNGGDAWQQASIGYGSPGVTEEYLFSAANSQAAPKNIGEGYRRNVPVMFYAYTPAFLYYFGTAGMTNIDNVFTNILNNAFSDNGVGTLSSYSSGLGEVPLDSMHINYTAQAYQITDIKSLVLALMMPQLGLLTPELDTWLLHDRYLPPGGTCPIDEDYTVVQRNYAITPTDLNTIQYSSYVNNVLYSFKIREFCTGTPTAVTVVVPVDPLADTFSSVAGGTLNGIPYNLLKGGYYTGLTADDIAGFRYLYNPKNINWETVEGGSLLFDVSTNKSFGQIQFPANTNSPTGYGTYNLASLWSYAKTNPPAAVEANFPGVVVSSSYSYFVLATNYTYSLTLTPPSIGSPFGTVPNLVLTTNYSLYLATNYVTSFANVIPVTTNNLTTNTIMTVKLSPPTGSPYGTPATYSTNYEKVLVQQPGGDFYVVPLIGTNRCGSGIQRLGLSTTIYTTNLISAVSTNLLASNSITSFGEEQFAISSYVSHDYIAFPVDCTNDANATGLYEGIDKIKFVRVNFDSLLSQVFEPFTNSFTMVAVTNSQTRVEHFDRLIVNPDIVLDAADLQGGPDDIPGSTWDAVQIPAWDEANELPLLAGPGTYLMLPNAAVNSQVILTLNKVGDVFLNGALANYAESTNGFLDQITQSSFLAFGSFDGTTNPPILYPNGTSIENLQDELLVQITPTPAELQGVVGYVGSPYLDSGTNVVFTLSGGGGAFDFADPYTWTSSAPPILGGLAANNGLPPGLTLSPATGKLSGVPTQAGTYDFTLTFTDYYSRSVQWNYTIIIQ